MSDDIIFLTKKLPSTFIEFVSSNRILSKRTCILLEAAFEHGGYVAGGFAALVARHLVMGEDNVDDFDYKVKKHLGNPQKTKEGLPWQNSGCGDIDVWFPDVLSFQKFQKDVRCDMLVSVGRVHVQDTVTGVGKEYIIPDEARVQVIKGFLFPVEEQLSRFDIYNSMVAITIDAIVYPEHWAALETSRTLHVVTWKRPWTVNRFLKYLDRKGYKAATPATADAFVDELVNALDWFRNTAPSLKEEEKHLEVSKSALLRLMARAPEKVQNRFKAIMPVLTPERLLEISAFFQTPVAYDCAMQEIHRRMPVPC